MRKLKPLKGAEGLPGLGPKNTRLPTIALYSETLGDKDTDPLVMQIWQTLGGRERDYKLAQQAATLKTEKLPEATTLELVIFLWLKEKGYQFEYQVQVNGGRRDVGGSVVDFVVRSGRNWAIRAQGDYYHSSYEQQGLDDMRKKLLIGAYAGQYQIDGVVDVWEGSVYADRETVMSQAVAGYQLPH